MAFEYQFPDPRSADPDGLLAAGGDLSIRSLVTAYSQGIFPWYSDQSPILWWSPDPRLVLFPERFVISDSLAQRIRNGGFVVTVDRNFEAVIKICSQIKRKEQDGTWITPEMTDAYIRLHRAGLAHSFETWHGEELIGGLYGVSLGKAFFGESMFHQKPDASKIALCALVKWCVKHEFHFIDAQQSTTHLKSLGAIDVSRNEFLELLDKALQSKTLTGQWNIA
jgi:leucyl/phenylalanyl-tRNA---protein transferase